MVGRKNVGVVSWNNKKLDEYRILFDDNSKLGDFNGVDETYFC